MYNRPTGRYRISLASIVPTGLPVSGVYMLIIVPKLVSGICLLLFPN